MKKNREKRAEAIQYRGQGFTFKQIAEKLNIPPATAYVWAHSVVVPSDLRIKRGRKRIRPIKLKQIFHRPCKKCGENFTTNFSLQTHCSAKCRKYLSLKIRTQKRRAMRKGAEFETIKAKEIFERDGWFCQICKKPTLTLNDLHNQPRSPELDHIIPLSKGGGHIKTNVQLVCRECNMKKSAKVPRGFILMSSNAIYREAHRSFKKNGVSSWMVF